MLQIVLAAALFSPPAPSPSATAVAVPTPALSPLQIFERTFRRLASYPVPTYAVWYSTWRVSDVKPDQTSRETTTSVIRYAVRIPDGLEYVSDPVTNGTLPPADIGHEFVGPFAWSLRSSNPVATSQQPGQPDVASGLKTIASVEAIANPPYRFELVGTEDIDGHATYHLRLRPVRDPKRYNLMDLWVGTTDFDLWRAAYLGSYTYRNLASPSYVSVDFKPVSGYWLSSRVIFTYVANGIADGGPNLLVSEVLLDTIAFPETLPSWLFDAAEYSKHQKANEPDLLLQILGPPPSPPPKQLDPNG